MEEIGEDAQVPASLLPSRGSKRALKWMLLGKHCWKSFPLLPLPVPGSCFIVKCVNSRNMSFPSDAGGCRSREEEAAGRDKDRAEKCRGRAVRNAEVERCGKHKTRATAARL